MCKVWSVHACLLCTAIMVMSISVVDLTKINKNQRSIHSKYIKMGIENLMRHRKRLEFLMLGN